MNKADNFDQISIKFVQPISAQACVCSTLNGDVYPADRKYKHTNIKDTNIQ